MEAMLRTYSIAILMHIYNSSFRRFYVLFSCFFVSLVAGQLVKMTAEELASKELAEWREREAKHQLEIIQKTELEMMTMPAKYLVKSHKGEEIIEDKVRIIWSFYQRF